MFELIKSSFLISLEKLSQVFFNIIRLKFAAIYLGPFGMGILAQAAALQLALTQISNCGAELGVKKVSAELWGKDEKPLLGSLIETTMIGIFVVGGGLVLIGAFFSESASGLIFGDKKYFFYIFLVLAGAWLGGVGNIFASFYQGTFQYVILLKGALIGGFLGTLASVWLIYRYQLSGAMVSIPVFAFCVTGTLMALFFTEFRKLAGGPLKHGFSSGIFKKLVRLGGLQLLVHVSNTVTLLILGGLIIRYLGVESNGLYQVAWVVGLQYVGIFTASLWSYSMPKTVVLRKDEQALTRFRNDVNRLLFLVIFPFMVLLIIFDRFWIPLLYSEAFLSAGVLVFWQLAGELLKTLRGVNNVALIASEKMFFLSAQTLATSVLHLALFMVLLGPLKLLAAPISYFITHLLMLVPNYAYAYSQDGYFPSGEALKMFAGVLPVFGILALVKSSVFLNAGSLIAVFCMVGALALWVFGTPAFRLYRGGFEKMIFKTRGA